MVAVTEENWNSCHYTKAGLKGFVSLNALQDIRDRQK